LLFFQRQKAVTLFYLLHFVALTSP
jgi:hypothetical protein